MKPKLNPRPRRNPNNKKKREPEQPPMRERLPRLPQPAEGANGDLPIETIDGGVAFDVHVVPRSAKNCVAGTHGKRLHVKVNAPPIEGAANQAVCVTIAKALGVSPRQVSIIRGFANRLKRVQVAGLTEPEARKAFVF